MADQKNRRQRQHQPSSQPSSPQREESRQQTQRTRGGDQPGRMDAPGRDRSNREPSSIAADRGMQSDRDRRASSDDRRDDELERERSRQTGAEPVESIDNEEDLN